MDTPASRPEDNDAIVASRRGLLRLGLGAATLGLAAGATGASQAGIGMDQGDAPSNGRLAKGMHVIITGSGSAMPDPERGGASVAVVIDGRIIQIDCGRRAQDNLMVGGGNPVDIDVMLLTHLHFDHIATYGYYLIANWIAGRQEKVKVFGPTGTAAMHAGALKMHAMDVEFVQGIVRNWPPKMSPKPSPDAPYAVSDAVPGTILETDKFKITALGTMHLAEPWKSMAYRVDSAYGSVVVTGDTAPVPAMAEFAHGVDILVHECQKPDVGMGTGGKHSSSEFQKGIAEHKQTGHTSPTELGELAARIQPKLLVPYHLPPFTSNAQAIAMSSLYTGGFPGFRIWADYIAAIKQSFHGPVALAQDGMVFDVSAPGRSF